MAENLVIIGFLMKNSFCDFILLVYKKDKKSQIYSSQWNKTTWSRME